MSSKSVVKKTVRYKAMQILVAVEQEEAYLNLKLSQVLEQSELSQLDKNLLTELVYGVTQRRLTLDYLMMNYVQKKIPLWLRTILRLSIFQLAYLDKIPSYAVLDEANQLTFVKADRSVVKFVNAVLRNFLREKAELLMTLHQLPLTRENVSVQTSMPIWLVDYFANQLPLEEVKALGLSLLEKPFLSVRVEKNLDIEQCLQGFDYILSPLSKQGTRMKNADILSSDLFKNGMVTIQDETSMLVAEAGQIKSSDKVLDACAAPGGKTTHIAQFLNAQQGGIVYALDKYDHKIDLIVENATRLNVLDKVKAIKLDATQVQRQFEAEYFDIVFVDAPCSGLGLMRRKPDIKYKKILNDLNTLSQIQLNILNAVDDTIKKGGKLVYSTCTLSQQENDAIIKQFLKAHSNYKRVELSFMNLPQNCYNSFGSIEIYPHYFNTDGFYICVLEKHD